ncbi:MAG TPA: hypothetical protein VKS60_16800 [Stellaceae bacterium]|nr:hypothetical protein [Stellaceae bacterium]
MAIAHVFAMKQSGLNKFLHAAVGTEPNGVTLSLISVFTRRGTDPWQEALRLAMLPRTEAIDSLALAIAAVPTGSWSLPAATTIATRLVALLPTQPGSLLPVVNEKRAGLKPAVKLGLAAALVAVVVACAFGFYGSSFLPLAGSHPKVTSDLP